MFDFKVKARSTSKTCHASSGDSDNNNDNNNSDNNDNGTVITVFSSSLAVLPDLTSAAVISVGFRGRSRIPLIKQKLQSSAD